MFPRTNDAEDMLGPLIADEKTVRAFHASQSDVFWASTPYVRLALYQELKEKFLAGREAIRR